MQDFHHNYIWFTSAFVYNFLKSKANIDVQKSTNVIWVTWNVSAIPRLLFDSFLLSSDQANILKVVFYINLPYKISAPLVSGKYEKNNFPRLLSYKGQQNTKYSLYHNRNLEECCSCEEVNILVLQIMMKNGHIRIRLTKQHIQNCLYSLTFLKRPSSWIHLHRSWIGCV